MEHEFPRFNAVEVNMMSPLALAYIGDAVYELYVRAYVMKKGNMPVNKLHRASTNFVSANAQSDIMNTLEEKLTEEELRVFKRGRNAHSYTSAKNADIVDYRRATGFEALIGYIFLKNDYKRLEELIDFALSVRSKSE